MNMPIYLSETTRIDDEGNVRTYATLDLDRLAEQLNGGEADELLTHQRALYAANARIRELELRAQVSESREREADRLYSQCAAALDRVQGERNAALAKAEELEVDKAALQAKLDDANAWIERIPASAAEVTNARIATLEARLGRLQCEKREAEKALDDKVESLEAQLAAQAEDHTPLSAIETLFTAGVNQCLIDEEYSSHTECPYPPDSISRHWWTRGYAHRARAFRAVELEARLKDAGKVAEASVNLYRAYMSNVSIEEDIQRLGLIWDGAVVEYINAQAALEPARQSAAEGGEGGQK